MNPRLRAQLIRHEGLRLKVYTDSLGHPTIGVGRALDVKGISAEEASLMLDHDIADAEAALGGLPWFVALDDARRGACLDMVFNLGPSGFLRFRKMIAALERADWETAAAEMLDSTWHTQVGVRAERLAQQIRTGAWLP